MFTFQHNNKRLDFGGVAGGVVEGGVENGCAWCERSI